jgi:DNA-binding beta-propeller fold protein YncE
MNFQTLRLAYALVFYTILGACMAPVSEPYPAPSDSTIAWPRPPETARIIFLESFQVPQDLGIRPSAFRRFMSAIAGEEDTGMVRPYAVSAYQQRLLVGDPGLHALHFFDRAKQSYKLISSLGEDDLISPVGVAQSQERLFLSDSALGKVFILNRKGELLNSITGLKRPTGLAFDTTLNRLYVADTLAHRILVFDQDGQQLFEFGTRGIGDGEFNFPSHIFMSAGRLLVNDNMNFRVQVFDAEGNILSVFGTHGDGSGSFSQPKGVAADSDGNIYVAGATIDRVQVFSSQGDFLLAFGGKGAGLGQFLMPTGVTITDDKVYVADSLNRRIQVFQYVHGN